MEQQQVLKHKTALITGASRGLGLAFARELASRGYDLILIALHNEGLVASCAVLESEFPVSVKHVECDLTQPNQIRILCDMVKDEPIQILINNAGIGGTKPFEEMTESEVNNILDLNIHAIVHLTHALISKLGQNSPAFVLNVASMAAFAPIGYKSIYSASKAFIAAFSNSLYHELKPKQIHVATVYPGPMATSADIQKRLSKQSLFGKMGTMDTNTVAKLTLDKMFRKESKIVVGIGNKIHRLLMALLPKKTVTALVSKAVEQEFSAN